MGEFPLMNSRFWRSMMDSGKDRGRVCAGVTTVRNRKPVGLTHCLGKASMSRSATTEGVDRRG
jgi:hypothetical protein